MQFRAERRFTLLVTLLAVTTALIAYVAWCSRSFYLGPQNLDYSALPAEIQETTPRLVRDSGLLKPRNFNPDLLIHLLSHPFDSQRDEIRMTPLSPHWMIISGVSGSMMKRPYLIFSSATGKWKNIPESELQHEWDEVRLREPQWDQSGEMSPEWNPSQLKNPFEK